MEKIHMIFLWIAVTAVGVYCTLGLLAYLVFACWLADEEFDPVEMLRVMLTWPDMIF
jgi:hypothetical protein